MKILPPSIFATLIGAKILGTLGCGNGDEGENFITPVCATPERQTPTPMPKNVEADRIVDGRLRVHFTMPEFDADCKAPLQVRVIATVFSDSPDAAFGRGAGDSRSQEMALPPYDQDTEGRPVGYEVFESGDNSMDCEIPAGLRVTSFVLEVIDAQRKRTRTRPVIVE